MKKLKKRTSISLLIKIILAISAILGVYLSLSGKGFMGGGTALLYFTIQSNLWIAAVCLAGAALIALRVQIRDWMYIIKLVFTVSITLTGFVFCFILAPTMKEGAWVFKNILTHVVVPVLAIADLLVFDCRFSYKFRHSLYTAIPPLYYMAFSAVGYVQGWNFGGGKNYPYFFLNWGSPAGIFGFTKELPFMGVFWWLVVLLFFLIVVSVLYMALMRKTAVKEKQN